MSLPRTALRLTPLAFLLIGMAAQAQGTRAAPEEPKVATPCPDDKRDDCPKSDEPDRPVRNNDAAAPQVVADAPLPAAGGDPNPPPSRFDRGPLKVRNFGLSVAFDHALSPQWVLGGLVNVSAGRISRSQTETDPLNAPPLVTRSDTTVDTRSTSLAGSLSYFTRDGIAFDGALSFMRTQLETTRAASDSNGNNNTFTGDNVSSAIGLFLSASRIWRFGPRAVIPQLGLEFTDTRTDPLVATAAGGGGFTVGEQKQRLLASLLSVQLQQPFSMGFGTLTPYGRVTWRQRLWKDADPVTGGTLTLARTLDPDSAESKSSFAVAGGVIAQFTRGVSTFLDVSYRQGSNQLRETRLGLGVKFEI
ncbi:MAG: autotransporter outer membrane beta-barrel domain-containing protein [Rhizobacter sp.]